MKSFSRDLDLALVMAICEGDLWASDVAAAGVEPSDFKSEKVAKVYSFLIDYEREYKEKPGIHEALSVAGLRRKDIKLAPKYILKKFMERKAFSVLVRYINELTELLKDNELESALSHVAGFALPVANVDETAVSMRAMAHHIKGHLESGDVFGMPYPWEKMNEMTNGMQPAEYSVFLARPNVGKTMALIIAALMVRDESERYRILFVTPEMSEKRWVKRACCIEARISYKRFLDGTLSGFEIEKLEKHLEMWEDNLDNDRIFVMDAGKNLTLPNIERNIRKFEPTLVILDSFYNLKIPGNREDRIKIASDWTYQSCRDFDCHFLLATQLGRGGDVALTDTLFQDADNMFDFEADEDLKRAGIIEAKHRKTRDGSWAESFFIAWDYDRMFWHQIEKEDEAPGWRRRKDDSTANKNRRSP